ncbi:AI-2E family transporter [filamentous cyanobacterium CCP5]|nr:AI-2E family transporter [filamentous cyanobacterium CCP5]
MRLANHSVRISVVVIAVILAIAALRASRPVTLPLAFTFFIVVLVQPLQAYLERRFPRWLSLVGVLAVLAAALGLFVGALSLSAEIIEPKLPGYYEQLKQSAIAFAELARSYGFPISLEALQSQASLQQLAQQTLGGVRSLVSAVSLLLLVGSMVALLLLEVRKYPARIRHGLPGSVGNKLIDAAASISQKLRQFLYVMSFTSLLTGLLTWLWCTVLGVELAIVWGLIACVLNFIPTLGSIIAVIPPTLVALIFGGPAVAIATLAGLAVMQLIMGNFVDPKLQGDSLQLSSFVALTSIVFWGWVWGIPGAFLGVPLTAAIAVICDEFQATRGVAILLGASEKLRD